MDSCGIQNSVKELFEVGVSDSGIAIKLGVKKWRVFEIRKQLGLARVRGGARRKLNWSEKDDCYIKENFRVKTYDEMEVVLGVSARSIRERISDLGLLGEGDSKRWDKIDDLLIIDMFHILAEKLEKDPNQIVNRAQYLISNRDAGNK